MKLGCLYSLLGFIALFVGGMFLGFLIDLLPGVHANYEGIGSLISWVFILLVGPAAFIYGFRLQERKDKEKATKNAKPEQLRPTNLSGLQKTLSQIAKDKENT